MHGHERLQKGERTLIMFTNHRSLRCRKLLFESAGRSGTNETGLAVAIPPAPVRTRMAGSSVYMTALSRA